MKKRLVLRSRGVKEWYPVRKVGRYAGTISGNESVE